MWFLNLLNPIGKLLDVVGAYVNKRQDVDLEKYRVKGNIDIKSIEADVAIIQARAKLAEAMKDDPATKTARVWILLPASVYFGVSFYYLTFANLLPSAIVWKPLDIPESLLYIPYVIMGYLFVTAWRGK